MASSSAGDDPSLLFTPQKPTNPPTQRDGGSASGSGIEQAMDTPPRRVPGVKVFSHVLLPRLDEATRARFAPFEADDPEEEVSGEVVEFVGDGEEDGVLYLFAMYDDDIIRRVSVQYVSYPILSCLKLYMWTYRKRRRSLRRVIQDSLTNLVSSPPSHANYWQSLTLLSAQKKESGLLADFDPSSRRVHPKHRIHPKIKISKLKHEQFQRTHERKGRRTSSSDSDHSGASSGQDDDDDEEGGNDEDEFGGRPQRKQQSRAVKNHALVQSQLPFSPKKTRSRGRVQTVELSDDEFEAGDKPALRRGTRTRTGQKNTVDYDDDYDELDDDGESEFDDEEVKGKKGSKGKRQAKALKPEYGRIHNIKDEGDYEEDASLRAHRDVCEKCDKQPSHLLLKKAKKKRGRRKRDDEFEETEEERALRLGGWVRWYSTFHAVIIRLWLIPFQS